MFLKILAHINKESEYLLILDSKTQKNLIKFKPIIAPPV